MNKVGIIMGKACIHQKFEMENWQYLACAINPSSFFELFSLFNKNPKIKKNTNY